MKLYEAAQDKYLMNELKEYFIKTLEKHAIEKVFAKENVSAVAEAKEVIDKAFESIELQFMPKSEKKEPLNEAR